MSRYRKLTTACFAAALVLGLAACGGGGSSPTTSDQNVPKPTTVSLDGVTTGYNALVPTKHAIKAGETATNGDVTFSCAAGGADCDVTVAADGSVTSTGGTVTAMDSAAYTKRIADNKADDDAKMRSAAIIRLHGEANGATSDAKAAGTAADQALKDAEEYDGELGVIATGGDSTMAQANAQKVLDAKTAATTAAQNASNAKTRAQTAKTEATALSDGADKTALIAALDEAIEEADDQIEATTAIRDGEKLKTAVEMVTGTATKKLTAADKGKAVADAIYSALTRTSDPDGVPAAVAIPSNHSANATTTELVMGPSDAQGMTWAQIGGSSLVDKRIAATGGGTTSVKAKSVAGMTVAKLYDADNLPDTAPATADGTQIDNNVEYKGIAGKLFCAGSDCKVEDVVTGTFAVATSKLTGSWYFTPDGAATVTYLAGTGASAGTYSVEAVTSYVRYGYWLDHDANPAATTVINRYHSGPPAESGAVYGISSTVDAFKDPTASYTGSALGMSVVQSFDSKGNELSRASGEFTADVSLTMNFGNTPWLYGTISNFEGSAVDSSWSVTLGNASLSGGNATGVTGKAPNTGAWTATAWGGAASDTGVTPNPAARPKGVYGAFDADFTNGAAAGVYATRKQ